MIEEYKLVGGKRLRFGYTTGSCATAAAKASAMMLFSNENVCSLCLRTPAGIELNLEILDISKKENSVSCAVKKDSGDDPDVTNGMLIYATVSKIDENIIVIKGGDGIGTVTKPGLDQKVGESAINSVPRKTITQALNEVALDNNYNGGFLVIISAPKGLELSKRTYNSRLGIIGGLSIIGTTGLVEPMSEDALIDTIYVQIDMQYALGKRVLLLTPGNYGWDFIGANYTLDNTIPIKCSNYVGQAIDYAYSKGFEAVLIIGHAGKLLKLGCGLFNTHSKYGDCRAELLSTYASINGADSSTIKNIVNSVMADEMILCLEKANVKEQVLKDVMKRIDFHINARVYNNIKIGAILFTDKLGIIGKTDNAQEILDRFGEHYG